MKNLLIVKDADFSNFAVEKVDIVAGDAPIILFGVNGIVTLSSVASNMYYTIDGSIPTVNSTKYTVPFTVTGGTVVKAIGATNTGNVSEVSSATFNAGGASILYKQNYTLGYPSSSSTVLTEIALSGYGISDFIQVPPYSNLNVNYGATVQTMGMWNEYYKFKIVEYDKDHNVVVSTEARENALGTSIPVGNNCIWSIRDGANNVDYKGIPVQQATRYIKIVVKLGTSANVVDMGKSNNVLFQYIPD